MSKFHPLAILLRFEGYPPAVVASLFLHGLLLLFILGRTVSPSDYVTIEDPVIVTATAVDVNPQRLRRIERLQQEEAAAARQRQQDQERQRQAQEARARQEREVQQARERAEAERQQQAQADAERRRQAEAEAQRQRDAEAARQRAAEQQRQQEQQRLAQEQAAREAEASQQASDNLIVAQYANIIKRLISQNWQIPPSARNGMMATVELRLVPTGEVVGATIIQASGDPVFDRSVLQAVERAGSFTELQDLAQQDRSLFDRNFRTFTLVFRPEDLLR